MAATGWTCLASTWNKRGAEINDQERHMLQRRLPESSPARRKILPGASRQEPKGVPNKATERTNRPSILKNQSSYTGSDSGGKDVSFHKGQRVQLSVSGISANLDSGRIPGRFGVVIGGGHGECIRVLKDGYKTAHSYHSSFWEPAQEGVPTEAEIAEEDKLLADAQRRTMEDAPCGHKVKYEIINLPGGIGCMVCDLESAEAERDQAKAELQEWRTLDPSLALAKSANNLQREIECRAANQDSVRRLTEKLETIERDTILKCAKAICCTCAKGEKPIFKNSMFWHRFKVTRQLESRDASEYESETCPVSALWHLLEPQSQLQDKQEG